MIFRLEERRCAMNPTPRSPPPKVLLVHDGSGYEAHVKYLTDAGLRVSETHADSALAEATTVQPDIIVIDFGCDGEVTSQLKGHAPTQHIPVIALVDLMPEG
jgi:PleD family two-component response regulator